MSKIGKAYIRTDELKKATRSSLPSNSLVAMYDTSQNEEFAVDQIEFANVNPTDDVMPVNDNGTFIDSPLTVVYDNGNPINIVSSVPMTIPSGTLALGGLLDNGTVLRGVTELKDSGESFLASDNITGNIGTVPISRIDDNENAILGVGRLRTLLGDTFSFDTFGGTDSDEITVIGDDKIIVSFREVETAYITAQKFRGTQGKMHYRVIDTTSHDGVDTLVYTSEQGDPIDFDSTVAPDFEVTYETLNPNFLIKDHLLRLEFFSADGNPMTMRGFPTSLPIPEAGSGDVTTFTPFFETKFSNASERIIFNNDQVVNVNSSEDILGSFCHAVDTTSGALTITADPDIVKLFDVFDSSSNFSSDNCTVDLKVENTRNTPNDSITSIDATQIKASALDAGVSGTKNLLSEGATPKVYNDGTNWLVVTDQETLNFDEVTDRSGIIFFRILGSKAVLSVGNTTQAIDSILGTKVVIDTIGNISDTIDSVTGLKLISGGALEFDDKTVDSSVVLNEDKDSFVFWFDGASWNSFDRNKIKEAPEDGKQYTRKDGAWEENNSNATVYVPSGDLTALTTQGAIDELETNKVDDVSNVGGENEVFKAKTGTVLDFRTMKAGVAMTINQNADDIEFIADVEEAPEDGNPYNRQDAGWVEDKFGQFYQFENDEGVSSTSSTSYQNKLTLTTPTLPIGTYKISWTVEMTNNSGDKPVEVRVQLDGSSENEIFYAPKFEDEYLGWSSFTSGDFVSATTHTVDLDFSSTSEGGTARVRRARIEIFRVG